MDRSAPWGLADWIGAVVPALLVLGLGVWISWSVFGGIPHVQDSIAQLFQARIFATGRLWAEAPAFPEFFEYTHVILQDGRWYSQYPPGHPLLLLPFEVAGAPWLANPFLGAVAVVGVYGLGREVGGRTLGRLAAMLAVLSPFLIMMHSEFMSHASGLATCTFFLFFFVRTLRTGALRDGIYAGTALALALLVRPYTAFGIALPCIGVSVWAWFRHSAGNLGDVEGAGSSSPGTRSALLGMGAMTVVGAGLLLLYNWGTTGSPLRFGYEELYGPSHGVGFGKGTWGPPHTWASGLEGTGEMFGALHRRLFEWPGTSLWPLALGLFVPASNRLRVALPMRLFLLAIPVSLAGVYVFYWYRDLCFGPRFLFEALGPMLVLSALGLLLAADRLPRPRRRWGAFVLPLLLSAVAASTTIPRLFAEPAYAEGKPPAAPETMASYFQYYGRSYWGVDPHLGRTVAETVQPPALVFVRTFEPPNDHPTLRHLWFGSAFAHQEPDLVDADVIYARDLGARNADLVRLHSGRRVYLYEGSIRDGRIREIER